METIGLYVLYVSFLSDFSLQRRLAELARKAVARIPLKLLQPGDKVGVFLIAIVHNFSHRGR